MANPYPKCGECSQRHRPDRGCVKVRPLGDRGSQGIRLYSIAIPVVDLTPLIAKLDAIEEKLARMVNAKWEIPADGERR
jgi:hypothetical protein